MLKMLIFQRFLTSACFHFQSEPVSNQRNEFAIRGFSFVIIDRIAEKGIDGVYLTSVPCNLDGVADFVPSALEEKLAIWLPFWKMNLLLNWSLYTLCIRWGFVFIQMVAKSKILVKL